MSVTGRGPGHNRTLDFGISNHAIERYRERATHENRALHDNDLRLVLNDQIMDAFKDGRTRVIEDAQAPGIDTTLAEIIDRECLVSYVVLRPNGQRQLCAITVLSPDMPPRLYASGQWHEPNRLLAPKLEAVHAPQSIGLRLERAVREKKAAKLRREQAQHALDAALADYSAAAEDVRRLVAELGDEDAA